MNKTININLAGLFFHIDEDAYNRLQKYLAAVRRSFSGTAGAEEIMSDIESRIAELFIERRKDDREVVSITHVEEVISIMGQPEDYEVDEEIFEDQHTMQKGSAYTFAQKKLYRDTANGYVGGVATGIAHYLAIEPVWSICLWVLFIFMSGGAIIPLYIILWVVIPDAVSTSDRLRMMGKEVNLSNLSETQRNDFNDVAGDAPGAGHGNIVGQRTKRGSVRFFGMLGRLIKGLFKVILKLVGLVIFIAAVSALIGTIISIITVGFINVDGLNLIEISDYVVPEEHSSWLLIVAFTLAVCIPLLALAGLGLRILVSNMKPVILPVKLALLALWILAVVFIAVTAINIAASQSYEARTIETKEFNLAPASTLQLNLDKTVDQSITEGVIINRQWLRMVDYQGEPMMAMDNVRTAIVPATDTIASVQMVYRARGANYDEAKDRASGIIYNYTLTDSTFTGSNRIILKKGTALAEHKLDLIYRLPYGTKVVMDHNFENSYRSWITDDAFSKDFRHGKTYEITEGKAVCLDCNNSPDRDAKTESEVIESGGGWEYEDENEAPVVNE